MAFIDLSGSNRAVMSGASITAPADDSERMEVSVLVRRRDAAGLRTRVAALTSGSQSRKIIMSREEFGRAHGADPADFALLHRFAATNGLVVAQEDAVRRTVVLAGTVKQFNAAFSVQLFRMTHAGGSFRGRTGVIRIPSELDGIVEAVLGLDNRPQATTHFRILPAIGSGSGTTRSAAVSYTPLEIAQLYGFPAGDGTGECVALIELGGGFDTADLDAYFIRLGVGSPAVTAVGVDHAGNAPTGDGNGPDGEVMLDVEIVGALVPGAGIAVYFAPNTDAGFLDAITTAIHDTARRPSVLSISWGGPESTWTAQAMTAMDDAFQAAAALGITVCVASGDNGAGDGVAGGNHVDFPASSPFALGCGGTSLKTAAGVIRSETVWDDAAGQGGASGGGVSAFFPLPNWQRGLTAREDKGQAVTLSMRGVPDVAGNADPATGYQVRVDGSDTVIGGTSAVAPLWAALIARINATTGKPAGFVNARLYAAPDALRDITSGGNEGFEAATGWDACTGLGSPGPALARVLVQVE